MRSQEIYIKKATTSMRRLYTDLDVINVVVLRHKGVSYRDIAKKCGLSPGTVQKILEKYSEIILPDLIPLLTKINQIMLSRKSQNTHTAKDTTASV
jgi:lambda repressor-like predicted transcriptional regulator